MGQAHGSLEPYYLLQGPASLNYHFLQYGQRKRETDANYSDGNSTFWFLNIIHVTLSVLKNEVWSLGRETQGGIGKGNPPPAAAQPSVAGEEEGDPHHSLPPRASPLPSPEDLEG